MSCKCDLSPKQTNKDLQKNTLVCYFLQQVVTEKAFDSLQLFLFILLSIFEQLYYTIVVLDSINSAVRHYNDTLTLDPWKYLFFINFPYINMITLQRYLKRQNNSNFCAHFLIFCSTAFKVCGFCIRDLKILNWFGMSNSIGTFKSQQFHPGINNQNNKMFH